jgi:hypothetical protein
VKHSLHSCCLLALLGVVILLWGCGDPEVGSAQQLEGNWRTLYYPEVIYSTDVCYGNLSPMAAETWDIYWEVKALNDVELDILMYWYPSNFTITDFACGTSTGVIQEYSPIEHIYGYIDGNRLILGHNYSGIGGQKLISANLRITSRNLEGAFGLDTYFGGFTTQSVSISGQGLQLEKY